MGCSGSKPSPAPDRIPQEDEHTKNSAPGQGAASSSTHEPPQNKQSEASALTDARRKNGTEAPQPVTVKHGVRQAAEPAARNMETMPAARVLDLEPQLRSSAPGAVAAGNGSQGSTMVSGSPKTAHPAVQPPSASPQPVPPPTTNSNGYVTRDKSHEPLAGHSRYRRIKDINSGASGFVQLAVDLQTEQEVAIKFVPRGSAYLQRAAEREIMNHRLLEGHAHIVQFHEVFLTERYLGIVMEYVSSGDMADLVDTWNSRNRQNRPIPAPGQAPKGTQCLPEAQARRLFQQLLVAVDFLHLLGIANRDIKLENALLSGNPDSADVQLKLCDFGYSKDEMGESLCKTLCGTPEYIAPEVLIDNRYHGKISDIWSAGVLLFVLLTGVFPFWRKDDEKLDSMTRLNRMFPRIVKAEYVLPSHVSPACRDLLARMMSVDTKRRTSVQSILQHPWFQEDLPPQLITMNSGLLALPIAERIKCPQTESDIRNIIRIAAAAVPSSSDSTAGVGGRSSSRQTQAPTSNGPQGPKAGQDIDAPVDTRRLSSVSDFVDQALSQEQR